MTSLDNAKLVYGTLQDNLKEINEMIKRTGDRMTVVLGAAITGFGLIVRLDDSAPTGWGLVFLVVSIAALVCTFFAAVTGLFPKKGEQPGSTDIDEIWRDFVLVPEESAIANSMNDLCRVIRQRREININMNWWFRATILCAAVALACIAVSEAIGSVG